MSEREGPVPKSKTLDGDRLSLRDRVVLVTGGSSGIGRAACLAYARQGCRVAIHYRSGRARAEAVADAIGRAGGHAATFEADLVIRDAARGLVEAVRQHFGRLDVLLSNAGGPIRRAAFHEVDSSLWDETVALNLSAPVWLTQAAIPWLRNTRGVILYVSTALTRRAGGGLNAHYTAVKGGLNALTVALAAELAPWGIRVNCLCPGAVDTELQERLSSPERRAQAAARSLLGRLGTPEEIAETLVFLASDAAGYINGQVIIADGGAR
jgi:3-oxoacyl-[acyl-carrier protein] reductase